ncbi:MAG: hypothetical protein AAGA30_16720 [Planctomycetota bacterium]
MNEENKSRTRLTIPLFGLSVLLLVGAVLAYSWLQPVDTASALTQKLRQDANRVGNKLAKDSRLRKTVTLNQFVVDIVYPMFDGENNKLVAPEIEFECNGAEISELTFTVYHDVNGVTPVLEPVLRSSKSHLLYC